MRIFGDPATWPNDDLVAVSEMFDPLIALAGYEEGTFPMPVGEGLTGWFSPMRRGILPELVVRRSLRKTTKRYTTTVDADFIGVIDACADPSREGAWIDDSIKSVYTQLQLLGRVHSVEVWDAEGRLVGGLYGVHHKGLFAGESMFHDPLLGRDASKTALIRLDRELRRLGVVLWDVQWKTPHLETMGVVEISRQEYLQRLETAIEMPDRRDWDRTPISGAELVAQHQQQARSRQQ